MRRAWIKWAQQSLFFPITLGVIATLFTIAVIVGWSVVFTRYYMLSRGVRLLTDVGVGYWLILSIGYMSLILVATTLILFLISNVRQKLYMRQQTSFIDSVTHELKSPLASLQLCLETMELRALEPAMQAKFLRMMRLDVERLNTFIEHILEAGRLEHDERDLSFESTELPDLARRCVEQLRERHQLPPEAIHSEFHLKDPSRSFLTAPIALDTILSNLLDNAVKYSKEKVQISLTIREKPHALQIEVKDRGIGLGRGQLKMIFKRFYRAPQRSLPAVRGTGLGLYVVASLVKRMGGRISASSDGEDQGSTFLVEFPWQNIERNESVGSLSAPTKA